MRSGKYTYGWILGLTVTLSWLFPFTGLAEDTDKATKDQDPLEIQTVVSATKTKIPLDQLTSSVEVITGEELKKRKIKTVIEALRLSQGLSVFQSGPPGTAVNVRIRGADANQTLVLIDGAIVNSPTLGTFNFATLTTDNIERIEILRGAQSMLWGGDAIGGVINIVTKRGRETPTVSVFAEYGSFASIREGGNVSGQKGPVDFSFALSRWDQAGFSAINFRRGATERDGFRNWQASSRLGIDLPASSRFEFDFRWMNSFINLDGFTFDPVTFAFNPADVFKAGTESNQLIFSGNFEQSITDWWSHKLTLARAQEDLETEEGTLQRDLVTGTTSIPSLANRSDIETLNNRIEWQHNLQIVDPLLLTFGYQFRGQQGENQSLTPIPTKTISSHSGFAQLQLNIADRLFATAGFRQDSFNTFGDATTWRVTGGYLHRETGTKIRGSYATGFRAPDINELFFPGFGNPNLQPEKSQSLDVGVDQTLFDDRLNISVTYFWNRFRNLIGTGSSPECPPSPFGPFCALNVGLAKSQGWEVATQAVLLQDLPWLNQVDLQAHYTHTLTRDLTTTARLPLWPVRQWSAILGYQPIDPLRIDLSFRYVGERFNTIGNQQPLPQFEVFDLIVNYDVTRTVQAYLRVDNLFNEEYEERLFFGTPVRSIFGGIRVNMELPFGQAS